METPRDLLRRFGLKPKKSWGQNFLADEGALSRIADAAVERPGQPVVELGAGLGHLTRFLSEKGAHVFAVERDRDMVKVLESLKLPSVTVVEASAAQLKLAKTAGVERVVVVGNLPYHLTSPILFQVLDQRACIERAVFTLQKEVVDRLVAPPGGRDYGLLTVLLGLYFRVEKLFDVPAGAFHPPPKVDSAVVRLESLERPRAEVVDDKRFRRVVKAAFAQRRKTLLNSLKTDRGFGDVAAALEAAGIDGSRRAETLSVDEFAAIERALAAAQAEL